MIRSRNCLWLAAYRHEFDFHTFKKIKYGMTPDVEVSASHTWAGEKLVATPKLSVFHGTEGSKADIFVQHFHLMESDLTQQIQLEQ
jgi:hypothetical protein